jgi:glycosyltransferase involved in cell wall biosynthesis
MRVLLDLQGAQASGRFRGVGRYSLSLARAILEQPREHEFWLLLNGLLHDSAAELAETLAPLVPRSRIVTFSAPGPVQEMDPANLWRTRAAELIREDAIMTLKPDVVHLSSLFEGIGHDAISSIGLSGAGIPTAVTLYDLIPLLSPDPYLSDSRVRDWYLRKLESLRRASMLLAISESAAEEARSALNVPGDKLRVIGAGVASVFRPMPPGPNDAALRTRYGLRNEFVLYAGGGDPRKNLVGLLEAFSRLDHELRQRTQLAVVGQLASNEADLLKQKLGELGIGDSEVVLLGYVPDADLAALYRMCAVFVLPSLHEGFGLPAAEAMACGAAAIGSNASSVPEIIDLPEARFNPRDPEDMARALGDVLRDHGFRAKLKEHGLARAPEFSWMSVASRAVDALEACWQSGLPTGLSVSLPNRVRLACVAFDRDDDAEQLMRDLANHYDVTDITNDSKIHDDVHGAIASKAVDFLRHNERLFDRILYIVNGAPGQAEAALFCACPGILLLRENPARLPEELFLTEALYLAHGLAAVKSISQNGLAETVRKYPPLEEFLTFGQGVMVQTEHMLENLRCLFGREAIDGAVQVIPANGPGDGDLYRDEIERFAASAARYRYRSLTDQLAGISIAPGPTRADWEQVALALSANLRWGGPKQILIDITLLAAADVGTGIQRVTSNIAFELIEAPPPGFKVELIRLTGEGFVYARDYARRFLGYGRPLPEDAPVEVHRGDVFLGLDLNMPTADVRPWFATARQQGARVLFVVYDLLPATMPEMFGPEMEAGYIRWLTAIIEFADGLLCISRSVADELRRWIDTHETRRREPLRIGWFHQGTRLSADPAASLDVEQTSMLAGIRGRFGVLAVGTIEPRKGYWQMLEAFESLWARGADVSLTIVGNRGWLVEDLLARLESHPERGRRLFWLSGVPDSFLAQLYQDADLLLAASFAEGFGLPLIEAQHFNLPVLARDIPVFREVMGDYALYFDTPDPSKLADMLEELSRSDLSSRVRASNSKTHDWRESALQLARHLQGGPWYLTGVPSEEARFNWKLGDDKARPGPIVEIGEVCEPSRDVGTNKSHGQGISTDRKAEGKLMTDSAPSL